MLMSGSGRDCGNPRVSPLCRRRSRNPLQPVPGPNGGVLISPRNHTRGLSRGLIACILCQIRHKRQAQPNSRLQPTAPAAIMRAPRLKRKSFYGLERGRGAGWPGLLIRKLPASSTCCGGRDVTGHRPTVEIVEALCSLSSTRTDGCDDSKGTDNG